MATELAPVDTSVVIPKHVREATERANAFYKPPSGDPQAQPQTPAQSADAPPAPAVSPSEVSPPVAPAADTSPVSPPAPPAAPEPPADWERRINAMKGRFEKEANANRQLVAQLGDMERRLAQLQAERVQAQQPAPAAPERITEDDVRDYGADFINVVRKAAAEVVQTNVQPMAQHVQHLEQQLQQERVNSLYQALDAAVPEWRTINHSPRFQQWIRLQDPFTGATRLDILNDAMRAASAPRVAAFFKGFMRDEAVVSPAAQPAALHAQPPRQPALKVEDLAAPGRARSTPDQVQPGAVEKPTFTRAEIDKFYADVRRRVYDGRENDRMAMERTIHAAIVEGRVR